MKILNKETVDAEEEAITEAPFASHVVVKTIGDRITLIEWCDDIRGLCRGYFLKPLDPKTIKEG
jgi:hypothetical protein